MNIDKVLKLFDMTVDSLDSWEIQACAGADWSWIEFNSIEYRTESGKRISFVIGHLNYGVAVYIDGYITITLNKYCRLFSKRWRKIRKLKNKLLIRDRSYKDNNLESLFNEPISKPNKVVQYPFNLLDDDTFTL